MSVFITCLADIFGYAKISVYCNCMELEGSDDPFKLKLTSEVAVCICCHFGLKLLGLALDASSSSNHLTSLICSVVREAAV
jgi:hypothetical protein